MSGTGVHTYPFGHVTYHCSVRRLVPSFCNYISTFTNACEWIIEAVYIIALGGQFMSFCACRFWNGSPPYAFSFPSYVHCSTPDEALQVLLGRRSVFSFLPDGQ